jgi:hypothetical protein
MTNAVYPKAKERAMGAGLNLSAGTVRCTLVDTAFYTFNAAHQFVSDVAVGARVGSPVTLAGKSVTDGLFDANDVSFTGITAAPTIEAMVLWVDTGSEATSPLIAYIDTATGLPVAAGSTQVDVAWDNGTNRIFRL